MSCHCAWSWPLQMKKMAGICQGRACEPWKVWTNRLLPASLYAQRKDLQLQRHCWERSKDTAGVKTPAICSGLISPYAFQAIFPGHTIKPLESERRARRQLLPWLPLISWLQTTGLWASYITDGTNPSASHWILINFIWSQTLAQQHNMTFAYLALRSRVR